MGQPTEREVEMEKTLRSHARLIYETAIKENMPNSAVEKALSQKAFGERVVLVSIGKAGWEMAKTAYEILGDKIDSGVVITKYDHAKGPLGNIEIYEAGHPVVDFNGVCATKRALEITSSLTEDDTVLFLVSGGGSALFESVDCSLEKMQELTKALLKSGATINEMNAIRKHVSNVKGGKLARAVYPAQVYAIVLSDVVGNDLSTIASGPATADTTTVEECMAILDKYGICLDEEMKSLVKRETPKEITNATHVISGSVTNLVKSAENVARSLGYNTLVIDDGVTCDATVIAEKIGSLAEKYENTKTPVAIFFGGEVTIKVKGDGKGGRNQELALLCAEKIKGKSKMAVFCVGSDGTDGPTDAAGGYVDAFTYEKIAKSGKSPEEYLKNNDSYNALALSNGLIFTGATGTNVNDLYALLIWRE